MYGRVDYCAVVPWFSCLRFRAGTGILRRIITMLAYGLLPCNMSRSRSRAEVEITVM
jgi:hypothetical protein